MPPRIQRQYSGVIHVHTNRSDGVGTVDEVIAAAKDNGLDFVVLTDHSTRGYAYDGIEGWYDGVLILCGEEVTTPQGHFLAFETREDVGKNFDLPGAIDEVHRQAGQVVATHLLPSIAFKNWPVPGTVELKHADALEIWDFTDEFLCRVQSRTAVQAMARADRLIMGPPRRILNKWDVELGRRRMPAYGGLNAHQKKAPLLDWKPIFPYAQTFGTIQTVINCRELPKIALRARDMVWESLREGRCFIANQSIAPAKGFDFFWQNRSGKVAAMGSQTGFDPGGYIHVRLPAEAEVAIWHNGQPLLWATGESIRFPAPTPGVYRVEVRLNRRVWILSNAIRLVNDDQPIQPTVSDFT